MDDGIEDEDGDVSAPDAEDTAAVKMLADRHAGWVPSTICNLVMFDRTGTDRHYCPILKGRSERSAMLSTS
jgi:hypothetical protein